MSSASGRGLAEHASVACVAAIVAATVTLAGCNDPASPIDAHPAAPQLAVAAPDVGQLIYGPYLVVYKDGVPDPPGLTRRLLATGGGILRFEYSAALTGFAAILPRSAAQALANNPNVRYVEPDRTVSVSDVETNAPWGLDRIDQAALPLNGSYSYTATGAAVNAYIIDTGIRTTHSEFGGRALSGYSAVNGKNNTDDCHGHGTHVAATVGGATYGVAKGVTLYAVRVLDCDGTGTISGIIAGIDWVTAHRILPAVANMSVGGGLSTAMNDAVQASIDAGVTYAVAAGNSGRDACNYSPASAPEALTVGATTRRDYQAWFTNYGPCVDLYAPGDSITSAGIASDVAIAIKSGTSMASPHVAGAAALYLQGHPTASPTEVRQALVGGATAGRIINLGAASPNLLLFVGTPGSTDSPVASFSATCQKRNCKFNAGKSSGSIQSYTWAFGDGSDSVTTDSPSTTHPYAAAGEYTVVLQVRTATGKSAEAVQKVKVR